MTASWDYAACILDLEGNELARLEHPNRVHYACFSPDGEWILTACEDRKARLWDLDGNEVQVFDGHEGAVKSALYARAGVPEYWIVDLDGDVIEVHGDPLNGAYRSRERYGPGDVLPAAPHRPEPVPARDVLPR